MHAMSVGFLLDKPCIFCIKAGNGIFLSQICFSIVGVGECHPHRVFMSALSFYGCLFLPHLGNSPRSAVCREQDPKLRAPLGEVGERWWCAAAGRCLAKESNKFQNLCH